VLWTQLKGQARPAKAPLEWERWTSLGCVSPRPAFTQGAGQHVECKAEPPDDHDAGHQLVVGQAVTGVEDEVTHAGGHAQHFRITLGKQLRAALASQKALDDLELEISFVLLHKTP